MSFRLLNAAQKFQRFMDDILWGLVFCFTYLEGILVFSWSGLSSTSFRGTEP
jgi:hypothetical protein